nr:hypothetical protein [Tanacetum cinerariifolium]
MAKNEVNEIKDKRLVRTANPLALVAQQQPVYHPQPNPIYYTLSSSSKLQAATRYRSKEIANSPPPTYDLEPEAVVDDEASSKEKEIDKLMDLISMYFKKIYKPTNNNLGTSSNTKNTNARENVGTQVVQQTRIQCYNCKEFGHVARESRIQLNAKQADWRDDTNDEPEDQEMEAYYITNIQEVTPDDVENSRPIFDTEPLEKQHQNEVNEIKDKRLVRTANPLALVAQQQPVYHPQPNPIYYTLSSSSKLQAATRYRSKEIANSPPPTYDLEPEAVVDDEASSKEKEIDKLMDLISMYFKKIYKPTNNNLGTSSNTKNTNADWRDDTNDEPEDQEMEAYYITNIQEVTPDDVENSRPIFDTEPLEKVKDNTEKGKIRAKPNKIKSKREA